MTAGCREGLPRSLACAGNGRDTYVVRDDGAGRGTVLWDVDGTLLHVGAVGREAFAVAFERVVGRAPVAPANELRFSGRLDPWIAEYICRLENLESSFEQPLLAGLSRELAVRTERLRIKGVVLPHVRNTLEHLAARGWRQGLVTGNMRAIARTKVTALGLAEHLDLRGSAYGDDAPRREDLVPIALGRAGRSADGAWVVGDTPYDLACARAGGVRCLLVATGPYTYEELAALGPDAVLPDLEGALDLLCD
jgi:phosphoglycolate phosphatase